MCIVQFGFGPFISTHFPPTHHHCCPPYQRILLWLLLLLLLLWWPSWWLLYKHTWTLFQHVMLLHYLQVSSNVFIILTSILSILFKYKHGSRISWIFQSKKRPTDIVLGGEGRLFDKQTQTEFNLPHVTHGQKYELAVSPKKNKLPKKAPISLMLTN